MSDYLTVQTEKHKAAFLYPFQQGERCFQGSIWSSKRKTVPAEAKHKKASHLETSSRTATRERERKGDKEEEQNERHAIHVSEHKQMAAFFCLITLMKEAFLTSCSI